MYQIIFNEISASELSGMPAAEQLKLIADFQVDESSLQAPNEQSRFGVVEREGKKIFRFRSEEYRVYFTIESSDKEDIVVVQRVLHANSLKDFLFRAKMGGGEDGALSQSRSFWKLIEEGEQSPRQ